MSKFIASWLEAAGGILEAELESSVDLLPGAVISEGEAGFTLVAEVAGDWAGSFAVTVDEGALGALLIAVESARAGAEAVAPPAMETVREEWQRLFRRICIAAAANLAAGSGAACEVAMISPNKEPVGERPAETAGMGYQLRAGEAMAALIVSDRVVLLDHAVLSDQAEKAVPERSRTPVAAAAALSEVLDRESANPGLAEGAQRDDAPTIDTKGIELLRDIELEASLRFGSREMALCDLLALGPGDVIQLDRALADPVDLIIGDKIVARGEVVLVNGNFGLQIAEVAEPRKSLESIRCLF